MLLKCTLTSQDMNKGLVSYSDSDSSDAESGLDHNSPNRHSLSTKHEVDPTETMDEGYPTSACKLPLPGEILQMFDKDDADELREESPARHDGRVRSFPHERGTWASYVFIPLLFTAHQMLLESFTACLSELLSDKVKVNTFPTTDMHISLSRTVPVPFHWIEPLAATLKEQVSKYKPFVISFSQLAYYSNDEGTRSFLGLKVNHGHDQMCKLVEDINHCFSRYRLPNFYENPSIHVSLCWCLGDHLVRLDRQTKALLQEKWEDLLLDQLNQLNQKSSCEFVIHNIAFKSGNKLFDFNLT